MTGNRWGQAKREVTALKPLIIQRLESGVSLRQIWLELREEGKVSIAQCNFYLQVRRLLTPEPAPTTGSAGGGLPLLRASTATASRTEIVSAPAVASSPEDAVTRQFQISKPSEGEELW